MAQSHGSVIAIAIVFTIFALIFVQLRVRARQMKGSAFAVDDYLVMAAAILLVICITIPVLVLAANSHLGDHTVLAPNGSPQPPTYAFNLALRISQILHVLPITTAKLGLLFFYRRIFRGPTFAIVNWATIVLVAGWGISFFFSILLQCLPIGLSLKLPPGSPALHCINETANFWALSISDVSIDLIILVIPFPFVWALQMSTKHKIGVSAMFLLGFLTIAASVARLVVFIHAGKLLAKNDPDLTSYVAPVSYWVLIESSLAIVSSCLPVLRPVFGGWNLGAVFSSFANILSLRSKDSAGSDARKDYGKLHGENSSLDSRRSKNGFSVKASAAPRALASDIELPARPARNGEERPTPGHLEAGFA